MNTIATINNPGQYFNMYGVWAVDNNGKTIDTPCFSTRKEAMKFITDNGYTYMTNKPFNDEAGYRAHIARNNADVDYSYASNG